MRAQAESKPDTRSRHAKKRAAPDNPESAAESALDNTSIFRSIYDKSPLGIGILDVSKKFLDANKAALDLFGVTKASELNSFKLFNKSGTSGKFKRHLKAGESITFRIPVDFEEIEKSGIISSRKSEILQLEFIVTPISLEAYLFIIQDITQQSLLEEKLRKDEYILNAAQQIAHLGSWDRDLKTNLCTWSDELCRICGLEEGQTWLDLESVMERVHSDDRLRITEANLDALRTGSPYDVVHQFVRPDGSMRFVHARGQTTLDKRSNTWHYVGTVLDITEQKLAEEKLRESKQKYLTLIETTSDFIWEMDAQGRYTYCSEQMEKLWGMKPEEMIGKTPFDVMPPDDKEKAIEYFRTIINNPKPFTGLVSTAYDKQGQLILVETSGVPFFDSNGRLSGFRGISRDITERKKADEALRESEQKYRELADSLPDIIFEADLQGNLTYSNKAGITLFGYMPEDLKNGIDVFDLIVPEQRSQAMAKFEKALQGQNIGVSEYMMCKRDSKTFPALVHTSPIIREGRPHGLRGVLVDITEQKQIEDALRQSEDKYRNLVENIHIGVGSVDLKGIIVYVNRALAAMMGYSPEELIGKHFSAFIPPDDLIKLSQALERGLTESKTSSQRHFKIISRNGSAINSYASITAIKQNNQLAGFNAMLIDMTEHIKNEEQLAAYQKELRSLAARLTLSEEQERRRIAVEIHDTLSQTLASLQMKLYGLIQWTSTESAMALTELHDINENLIKITRSLIFQLSSPLLYEVGLEAALEQLFEQFHEQHRIQIEFNNKGLDKPLDKDVAILLFQMVRELLMNVVRHAHAERTNVNLETHNDTLQIVIEDDGVGFDVAKMQSQRQRKQSFGLFSIEERLNYINGKMKIESEPGNGTRVTLKLPINQVGS